MGSRSTVGDGFASFPRPPIGFVIRRFLLLFLVFAIELILLSMVFDGPAVRSNSLRSTKLLGDLAEPVAHFLVSFAILSATLIFLRRRAALETFCHEVAHNPLRSLAVLLHATLFAGLMLIAGRLSSPGIAQTGIPAAAFIFLSIGVILSGMYATARVPQWVRLAKSTGTMWLYAAGAALAAVGMSKSWQSLWRPTLNMTFALVQWMLRPLLGRLIVEPDKMHISTGRYGVIISRQCSGLEGMGLLLLFGAVWLWLYRKECRFPRAFLLLPVGLVTLFFLNSVRIATLVLIGHAGAHEVAGRGFHSQAGWIAFNSVAFGLCVAAGRIPWLMRQPAGGRAVGLDISGTAAATIRAEADSAVANPVAVYLGPFLAILAAGMLARAMTGGFEWLYPVRILAACGVFWAYRREYRRMDWQFTWRGPATGLLVFAVWIGLEWVLSGSPSAPIPSALQMAAPGARWAWLAARSLCAIAIVPVAEELAFRGYLLRRLVSTDFEKFPSTQFNLWSLAISSLLFGAMHGERWLAGTIAGLMYALIYRRRGQLADAIVAHATTNAVIAAAVLYSGWWKLW